MIAIQVEELAAWLADHPEILWSVDGDYDLEGRLVLPCASADLAEALRERGGRLGVDAPSNAPTELTRQNMEAAATTDDGSRVFTLAWPNDDAFGEPWLLIEDTLAMKASA